MTSTVGWVTATVGWVSCRDDFKMNGYSLLNWPTQGKLCHNSNVVFNFHSNVCFVESSQVSPACSQSVPICSSVPSRLAPCFIDISDITGVIHAFSSVSPNTKAAMAAWPISLRATLRSDILVLPGSFACNPTTYTVDI